MVFFLQLLANYAGLIYVVCIIGAVLYLREIMVARQAGRKALYSLEREAAGTRMARGTLMIGAFGLVALATYLLSTYVAPTLEAAAEAATPTPQFVLATKTPTPTYQPSPTRTPRPTETPTGSAPPPTVAAPGAATEAPTPTPPVALVANCPDPNVQLVAPVAGQTFSGPIQLRGTADAPNFAFYKFTIRGPATNDAEVTAGEVVRTPMRDNVLGEIDAGALLQQPGQYLISLVVVDNTGNELPHCTVPVLIQPAP